MKKNAAFVLLGLRLNPAKMTAADRWYDEATVASDAKLGGSMPPFGQLLSEQEIQAVIAYFQSKWPEDVYPHWAQRT